MRIGHEVRAAIPDGLIPFVLPMLPPQHVIVGVQDHAHLPVPGEGGFVDGVFGIDVCSNEMPEASNSVSMAFVRNLFLQSARARLMSAAIMV